MGGIRAGTHGKLAEARCPWILGTGLAVYNWCTTVDMTPYVLIEGSIRTVAGIGVAEGEEGVHLAHNLNDLRNKSQ